MFIGTKVNMASKLVQITLHGKLGEAVGKDWSLCAKNLSECLRFIEMNTKKLYKTLYDFDKENIRYQVIVNGRKCSFDKEMTLDNPQDIMDSELMINYKDLETVDIVPVFEGADSDFFQALLGVILIVVGVIVGWTGVGVALVGAGLTLLASGVVGLLSKPPKFEDFREIEQGGKSSYLFSGPANIIGEGGPVPVGYGRAVIGSQVISAAYVILDFSTTDTSLILRNEYGDLIPIRR